MRLSGSGMARQQRAVVVARLYGVPASVGFVVYIPRTVACLNFNPRNFDKLMSINICVQ